jgi:DSBA-like thioredoxin domain
MEIIIYADFSCPYSYLASLRADQLLWSGAAEIDWRAVTHSTDDGRDDRDRDLAEVAALAGPGEQGPHSLAGPVNEGAAVAAYAEAVSDGVQDQLRRRLFDAIWTEARRVSAVYEVRHLIADVICPPEPIWPRLISPDLPSARSPPRRQRIARSGRRAPRRCRPSWPARPGRPGTCRAFR